MKRAYSMLEIKTIKEVGDFYEISGMATTPTPDRMGDIVDPLGATFAPEIPLLWQHEASAPVGLTRFGKPSKQGIPFTARLPIVKEEGALRNRIEEAVQSIKYRLVAAVSIGFRVLNDAVERLKDGGLHFLETEIMELSLVTIPAQAEATIRTVKSLDSIALAASGHVERGVVRLTPSPGASGTAAPAASATTPVVRATAPKPQEGKDMNIAEKLKQFREERARKAARMEAIMDEAGESTLDASQKEEFDTLKGEVATIDEHLKDLECLEKALISTATRVPSAPAAGADPAQTQRSAEQARGGQSVIHVERKLAPGVGFARYAGIMAASKGSVSDALAIAKEIFPEEVRLHALIQNHRLINHNQQKAAVDIGTTTDSDYAAPLVYAQNLASEFLEFLRPQTIIGRIPGLRRVPFNVRVPRQTSGGSASWVGEAKPKPLTSVALDYVELKYKKLATIAVISQELARFSTPSAEMIIRDTLAAAIVQQMDSDFVNPSNAGTSNVKPASVTYGVSAVVTTGDTEEKIRRDLRNIFAPFIAANLTPANGVWIMSATNALGLSLMVNSLGQPSFPGITMNGGTLAGMPVIVSEAVGNIVILLNASDILVADDGGVNIDTSGEASVQMDSAPDDPESASTVFVSLWQRNLLGIRAERFIDWVKGRSAAVQYLSGVEWGLEST